MTEYRSYPPYSYRPCHRSTGCWIFRSWTSEPRVLALLASVLIFASLPAAVQARGETVGIFRSREHSFRLVKVLDRLDSPWALAFLPDGGMLITEQGGLLLLVRAGRPEPVTGLPSVNASGQGGLLDFAVSPGFAADRTVFFTYSQPGPGGAGTALARAVLDGNALRDVRTIWSMERKTPAGQHFGSRIRFLSDGTLLFSTGDRGQGARARGRTDFCTFLRTSPPGPFTGWSRGTEKREPGTGILTAGASPDWVRTW